MARKQQDPGRDKALGAAYQAATQRLRANHRPEFNELYAEEASKRGQVWKPRLTEAEKDAEAFDALLAKHPEFATRVVGEES